MEVHPSPGRPHHVKSEGMDRGVYVRVGSTNRHADRELVDELRRSSRGEAYDEQAMPDLDSEALDFRAASESFAPTRRLRRNDLETLRQILHPGISLSPTTMLITWRSKIVFDRDAPTTAPSLSLTRCLCAVVRCGRSSRSARCRRRPFDRPRAPMQHIEGMKILLTDVDGRNRFSQSTIPFT